MSQTTYRHLVAKLDRLRRIVDDIEASYNRGDAPKPLEPEVARPVEGQDEE